MRPTPAFVSFLAVEALQVDLPAIERCCREVRAKDAGRKASNDGGYQSGNLDLGVASPLTDLLREVEARANALHAALMFKTSLRQALDTAWININRRGDSNTPHVHPRACFSGVFYVKAPKGCGDLMLRNPTANLEHIITEAHVETYNAFTSPQLTVPAEAGKLVIFPSWILHYVKGNQTDEDRISIAFNTVFRPKT